MSTTIDPTLTLTDMQWFTLVTDGGAADYGQTLRFLIRHDAIEGIRSVLHAAEDQVPDGGMSFVTALAFFDGGLTRRGNVEPFTVPVDMVDAVITQLKGFRVA